MLFTFRCQQCGQRKFFSTFTIIDGRRRCPDCVLQLRDQEQQRRDQKRAHEQRLRKQKRKIENRKKADEELRKQLQEEQLKQKQKKRKKPIKKEPKLEFLLPSSQMIHVSREREAAQASKEYDSVLYVYADVKHVRVLEWKNGKKRIALNKEREIRRTHKGGWSQEKFQRYVDFRKQQTPQWIEKQLTQTGVLRPPYQKILVDVQDEQLEKHIYTVLDRAGC